MMDLIEYQRLAMRTATTPRGFKDPREYYPCAIYGECGEVLQLFAKHHRDCGGEPALHALRCPKHHPMLIDEGGDLLWMGVTYLHHETQHPLQDVGFLAAYRPTRSAEELELRLGATGYDSLRAGWGMSRQQVAVECIRRVMDLAGLLAVPLEVIMEHNIAKLEARYGLSRESA